MPELTTAELDRAAGLLLGAAVGAGLAAGFPAGTPAPVGTADVSAAGRTPGAWMEATLAHLDPAPDDEDALAAAALALTHDDVEAGEACLLWCLAMRHAVRTGLLDARVGLPRLEPDRGELWAHRLDDAAAEPAAGFPENDSIVAMLQGAWSAITRTPVPPENPREGSFRVQHLQNALEAAAGAGEAAAAAAGGLLGAAYGASAVPAAWRRVVQDPSGLRARDLIAASAALVTGQAPFDGDYSMAGDLSVVGRHPYDPDLWIGGYKSLRKPPPGVDAVVSLCPVGPDDLPEGVEVVEVHLLDHPHPDENPNLAFVLHDTVDLLRALRAEGRTVLLHSVCANNRVPLVAAAYGLRLHAVPATLVIAEIRSTLFSVTVMHEAFRDALDAGAAVPEGVPQERLRTTLGGTPGRNAKHHPTAADWPEGREPRRWNR